jgi:hypothetical protein
VKDTSWSARLSVTGGGTGEVAPLDKTSGFHPLAVWRDNATESLAAPMRPPDRGRECRRGSN